jgi:RimJ/RimL family protein N-acetyltransferase
MIIRCRRSFTWSWTSWPDDVVFGSASTVEIGYSVIPEARNQGIATECVRALVERSFGFPHLQCVLAQTRDDTNVASTRVLLACGFRRIGPGSESDLVLYRRKRAATV